MPNEPRRYEREAERVAAASATLEADPDTDLLDGNQVAALLKVTRRTIVNWTADGTLKSVLVGPATAKRRMRRYRRADVLALVHEE